MSKAEVSKPLDNSINHDNTINKLEQLSSNHNHNHDSDNNSCCGEHTHSNNDSCTNNSNHESQPSVSKENTTNPLTDNNTNSSDNTSVQSKVIAESNLVNANPTLYNPEETEDDNVEPLSDTYLDNLRDEIFSSIRHIQDPEHPHTLEQLRVVSKKWIIVSRNTELNCDYINLQFHPTVPHCSLSTLIGLCLRTKLSEDFPNNTKINISIIPGTHTQAQEITKQLNDKERATAALENPPLRQTVTHLTTAKHEID